LLGEIAESNTLLRIYHKGKLLDVIPGNGDIPIGPFPIRDTATMLLITDELHPECRMQLPLTMPLSCTETRDTTCILKITKMHISECQEPFGIKDEGITIDLAAYSSAYPIDLSINNRPIHQLSDDRMYSFTLPLVQNDSDTNILTISNPEGCRLEYPLHHPCSSPTLDF